MSEQKDLERARVVDAMCMTWRHDFVLDRKDDELGSCGMTGTERDALRRKMGQLYDHHIAPLVQARARLPVGVPDALREAVEYLDDNPFNEIGAGSILHRAMRDALAAAATVKAEQVKTGADWVMRLLDTGEWRLTRFRNDPSMTEDYRRRNSWQVERQCAPYCGDNEVTFWRAETAEQAFTAAINDLFPGRAAELARPAPSLPAAGSDELEEAAGILRNMIDSIDVHGNYSKESTLLFLNQALSSIDAALSAQQTAPERVSVPVELAARLQRFCQRPHSSRDEADALDMELSALLASHAEGGKV